jgi:hypothetical protein
MERQKFEAMFPSLVAHYPRVRGREHYSPPERRTPRPATQHVADGADLTARISSHGVLWAAFEDLLSIFIRTDDVARVKRTFATVYEEHLNSLNLEQIEEVAKCTG